MEKQGARECIEFRRFCSVMAHVVLNCDQIGKIKEILCEKVKKKMRTDLLRDKVAEGQVVHIWEEMKLWEFKTERTQSRTIGKVGGGGRCAHI